MDRYLATIRQISKLNPIEGADNIEVATVDNWKVVVAKSAKHAVGDHIVYCEVDSFLPIREEFEFLRKSSYKKMIDTEGFRLKTVKLRGQISQGLVLPLDSLAELREKFINAGGYTCDIGEDVTELLGILKYEQPIPAELQGLMKGSFPSFIAKTDEERIQNFTTEYDEWKEQDKELYLTEKLDGSSATFYHSDSGFGVCSRNIELLETEGNTFWKVARNLDLENKLKIFGGNIALQGELIGEGIQGNPYKIKGQAVKFFSIFDIDQMMYYSFPTFLDIIKELGLDTVPILDRQYVLPDTIDELILQADGKSVLNSNTIREGVVIRSYDRSISFKVIGNKFLLNKEK